MSDSWSHKLPRVVLMPVCHNRMVHHVRSSVCHCHDIIYMVVHVYTR